MALEMGFLSLGMLIIENRDGIGPLGARRKLLCVWGPDPAFPLGGACVLSPDRYSRLGPPERTGPVLLVQAWTHPHLPSFLGESCEGKVGQVRLPPLLSVARGTQGRVRAVPLSVLSGGCHPAGKVCVVRGGYCLRWWPPTLVLPELTLATLRGVTGLGSLPADPSPGPLWHRLACLPNTGTLARSIGIHPQA